MIKVVWTNVVLSHRHRVLAVQDAMPPIARHEDGLPRVLQSLIDGHVRVFLLQSRQNEVIVHDGFVILAFLDHILALHSTSCLAWLEKHPMFASMSYHIPRCSAQGICVDGGATSFWTYAEPSVGRAGVLVHQAEPIMWKQVWNLKVIVDLTDVRILIHTRLEEVQRTVILLMSHVICVVFELHSELLALVILGNLEVHILESLLQCISSPSLHSWPVICHSLNDNRLVLYSKVLVEELRCNLRALHPGDGHCLRVIHNRSPQHLVPLGVAKLCPVLYFNVTALALLAAVHLAGSPSVIKLWLGQRNLQRRWTSDWGRGVRSL
mmetsp:Transcript_66035/g.157908  ORF Transcript_66035/g.157908 Transcript_66035/m.157908 type:complete len:323 (+) Transcript_66035:730-1698(+)